MADQSTIRSTLRDLGLASGDTVVVHSALRGMSCSPETLLEALLAVLGEDGTLVVPTFTPTFRQKSPDGVFNLAESPSEVGYFSELVRTRPGATRNVDPTHSFAALGARADEFGRLHAHGTYDRTNVLGRLHETGAWMLGIGLERFGRSMTFFHYVEQREGIDRQGWHYRHEKSFPGTAVVNGKEFDVRHTIHVQNFENGVTYDFAPLGDALDLAGLTRTAQAADKEFVLWNAVEAYDTLAEVIVSDPERVYTVGGE
ncbi:AAC(3) family N-acetyltransferase [Saliphagus sp. LR7]|uniref:AAC(3) family N-acetyltransferase n=1 Tax=Saliphagus sp. LR7 TaxID=2282654 RepID=UPI000DF7EDE3|nr:AAC(3) family N-acetyltransferase [Saliphagus sp. LR7]